MTRRLTGERRKMHGGDLIIANAAVWARPGTDIVRGRAVIVLDGRIDRLVAMSDVASLPSNIPALDAGGCVLTAGFWNCHVHLTEPV